MFMIIISHTVVHHKEVTPPLVLHYLYANRWGQWASALFLFLSGFGMYFSINNAKKITYSYIKRKIQKLLYPFLYVWSVYILGFLLFDRQKFSWSLITDFLTFAVPYAETWFFREIVALYFLSFFIFFFFKIDFYRISILLFLCLFFCFICKYFTSLGSWWYNSTLCFPLGMMLAWKWDDVKKMPPYLVLIISVLLFVLTNLYYPNNYICGILFSVMMPYLFSVFNLSVGFLQFVGIYSLCFYLLESPIKAFFVAYFHFGNFYLYISLCILGITLATLLYKQIEQQFSFDNKQLTIDKN